MVSFSRLAVALLVGTLLSAAASAQPAAVPSTAELAAGIERALAGGDTDGAVALATHAVAARPDSARLHALAGRSLALAKRFDEASDHLKRAVELGATDVRTLLFYGSALWESGDVAAAEEPLRQAAQAARGTPAEFLAAHQLGRLLLFAGKAAEAVAPLRRAVELDSRAPDATLDLARALAGAGQTEEAIPVFRRAVELAPDSQYACWGLARALASAGEKEEAAKELETYRKLYAADQARTARVLRQHTELDRAWHLLTSGDPQAAEKVFAGLDPGIDSLLGLARARAVQGHHAAAVEALERAVSLAPDRQDLRQILAQERLAAQGSSRPSGPSGPDGGSG
jgi:Flp pilus assembly protein TadD